MKIFLKNTDTFLLSSDRSQSQNLKKLNTELFIIIIHLHFLSMICTFSRLLSTVNIFINIVYTYKLVYITALYTQHCSLTAQLMRSTSLFPFN